VHSHRLTQQREVIAAIVRQARDHPSAVEVYHQASAVLPRISLGTVYRVLAWLRDQDVVREMTGPGGPARYDGNLRDHGHLVCLQCGQIRDLEIPPPLLATLRNQSTTQGWHPSSLTIYVYGTCPRCGETAARTHGQQDC
jgi:Fe2+ or Zn2+ uptake regulation protein